jgi:hypothetical protein
MTALPKPLNGCDWDDITPKGWDSPNGKGTPPTIPIDQAFHALAVVPEDRQSARPEIVVAGSDFGVWMRVEALDGSRAWCHLKVDARTPHPPVMDLKVHPATHGIYAFTFGRGVFRLKNVARAARDCRNALGY